MFITVAHYKGGAGKTTTAVHLAAYLAGRGKTLLIDSDLNRSASAWAGEGKLPFHVLTAEEGLMRVREFEHCVIDTEARPSASDMASLARGCNLLVVPAVPAGLETHALALILGALKEMGSKNYKVLPVIVPPANEPDGEELRRTIEKYGVPRFQAEIPRLKVFRKAFDEGVTVGSLKGADAKRAWAAYEAAGEELGV